MLINVNIKSVLIAILVLAIYGGIMFFVGTQYVEKIPAKPIIIEVPALTASTEVVQLESPRPIIQLGKPINAKVDSTYFYKYMEQVRETDRLQMYIDAITINTDTVTLVDDAHVKIDVMSETRGSLISQYAEYTIKSQQVSVVQEAYKIPKVKLFAGGYFTVPFYEPERNVTMGANLMLQRSKQEDMFSLGIDTERVVHFGYSVRLFGRKK